MYKEFYANMEWATLPIVALLFFLVAFSLILLRTFAARSKHDFDVVASLPLGDDAGLGPLQGTRVGNPSSRPTGSEVRP